MATGTRQTNTMQEQLRKLLGSFAELKLTEDADFDYIGQLETAVIGKLREPLDRAAQAGLTQAPPGVLGGAGMGGGMAGGMAGGMGGMGMPPPPPPMMPPGGGQMMPRPSPNMAGAADELRRILNQG